MNKKLLFLSLIALLTTVLLISGCSNYTENKTEPDNSSVDVSQAEMAERHTRSDSQGDVVTDVVWSTPELYEITGNEDLIDEYELDKYIVFDLSLSTHSGDLLDFSYQENVYLRIDTVELSPESITVLSKDSHHPRLLLKFISDTEFSATGNTLELLIKNLRDVPVRRFTW